MSARAIDLNADVGEDPEALRSGAEAALLDHVTSANVACGGHAGDEETMAAAVRLARERDVAVGAHPGTADRAGFGRGEMALSPREVEETVAVQVRRLGRVASGLGVPLRHLKPHGALYHATGRSREVAEAVARGARVWPDDLALVALAGSQALEVWRSMGLRAVAEAFADRVYEPDGSLRSRSLPGALLLDPAAAADQAVRLARAGAADTICVHSDTPGAPLLARAVRLALEAAGFQVRAP